MLRETPSFFGRLFLGVAGALGAVSATMIIVSVTPWLADLLRLDRVVDMYRSLFRGPIFKLIFGTDLDVPWTNVFIDVSVLWLSLFAAINVFVYRSEGVFLWGHIRKNYCSRSAPTLLGSGLCTLSKVLYAFAATPIACGRMLIASLRSRHTLFTSSYITLEPRELGRYLRIMGMAIGVLIAVCTLLSNYILR